MFNSVPQKVLAKDTAGLSSSPAPAPVAFIFIELYEFVRARLKIMTVFCTIMKCFGVQELCLFLC